MGSVMDAESCRMVRGRTGPDSSWPSSCPLNGFQVGRTGFSHRYHGTPFAPECADGQRWAHLRQQEWYRGRIASVSCKCRKRKLFCCPLLSEDPLGRIGKDALYEKLSKILHQLFSPAPDPGKTLGKMDAERPY